jgi:hypothetical protein
MRIMYYDAIRLTYLSFLRDHWGSYSIMDYVLMCVKDQLEMIFYNRDCHVRQYKIGIFGEIWIIWLS